MLKGVYIGTSNHGDYGLISTGDYLNPASFTFRLKDSGKTLQKVQDLYIVVNDINVEFIKIGVIGGMTSVRYELSWDSTNWFAELIKEEEIDATDKTLNYPFKLRFNVDDMVDYFVVGGITKITNFKMKLTYG